MLTDHVFLTRSIKTWNLVLGNKVMSQSTRRMNNSTYTYSLSFMTTVFTVLKWHPLEKKVFYKKVEKLYAFLLLSFLKTYIKFILVSVYVWICANTDRCSLRMETEVRWLNLELQDAESHQTLVLGTKSERTTSTLSCWPLEDNSDRTVIVTRLYSFQSGHRTSFMVLFTHLQYKSQPLTPGKLVHLYFEKVNHTASENYEALSVC